MSDFARKTARFWILKGKHDFLRKKCDLLVWLHFRTTPRSATPDTLSDIIQEQLRMAIRDLEFRCYTIKQQYEALGKELLHDHSTRQDDNEAEQEESPPPWEQESGAQETPELGGHACGHPQSVRAPAQRVRGAVRGKPH